MADFKAYPHPTAQQEAMHDCMVTISYLKACRRSMNHGTACSVLLAECEATGRGLLVHFATSPCHGELIVR